MKTSALYPISRKNEKNDLYGPISEKPEILESGYKLSQIDIKVSAKFPGQVFSVVQISAVFTVM